MNEFVRMVIVFILCLFAIFISMRFYYALNIKKEYRFLHYKHIVVLVLDIFVIAGAYFIIYILSLFNSGFVEIYNRISSSNIVLILILSVYLVYKAIYYLYYLLYEDKIINSTFDWLPKQYYYKDGKYYLLSNYISLFKTFRYSCVLIVIILSFLISIFDCVYNISFDSIISIISTFMMIILLLLELSVYFDGLLEDYSLRKKNKRNNKGNVLWNLLDLEYRKLWKNKLLSSYNIVNKYETKVIENNYNVDEISKNITKEITDNKFKNLIYGKIFSSISNGKNIIIESCYLESFSNMIVPIINILFHENKRMMIITDSYDNVRLCSDWLEKLNIKNSEIVVDIFSYDNDYSIKLDNKVDVYVGTVDLAIENRDILEDIDVVFCFNIDKMISENALNLNLLSSFLANNTNDVQYIMFGNRINGLAQKISQVFMKSNFDYHTIENGIDKQINVNFWKSEGEWFQSNVLSGLVSSNLGQVIPLALPAFKHGVEKVNVISSKQVLKDQLMAVQTTQHSLKKYIEKDIINIDDSFDLSQNENFIELDKNAVVVVEDNYNNAALVLLNYLKYTKNNMYLNVVMNPYILRDYIISNMDFFINNVEVIGTLLPISKTNIKLSLYRIINQLCCGDVAEDILLEEIKKINVDKNIDVFGQEQERFIIDSLEKLIRDIFGVKICLETYLNKCKRIVSNKIHEKQYYSLLKSIRDELPSRLFKNIIFRDSEQSNKILKKIPVFELYQNYLEGQYVTFDGRCYLIDRIDYEDGIVNLVYSNNNENVIYRQCREVNNINTIIVNKELNSLKVRNSILKKSILCTDLDVQTKGYYQFNNDISFVPGEFGYKEIDVLKKGLIRNYKSTNVLAINISNDTILNMNEEEKFRLSFTFSVLLNEIFETLFYNIKQYIIVRNVVNDEKVYFKYSNDELIKLYKPMIDTNINDGINIYITEDTELEKGIIDTIVENFDNIIMPLLYDYLHWVLNEDKCISEEKWYLTSGDYINFSNIDKLSFLKYGNDEVYEFLDLNGCMDCLNELILCGNDRLTNNRIEFVNKRTLDESFEISLIEDKKEHLKKEVVKSKARPVEVKTFMERIKELFKKRKKIKSNKKNNTKINK